MANLLMSTVGGGDCGNGWTRVAASGLGAGALMGGEAAKPEAQAKAQMAIFAVIISSPNNGPPSGRWAEAAIRHDSLCS